MEDERTNSKRPGRKALFVGATPRTSTAGEITGDDPGEAFAGAILETIRKFNSGDADARIEETETEEKYVQAVKSINQVLDSYSKPRITEDLSPEIDDLKSQLKLSDEKLDASEEKLKSSEQEISRLNDIIRETEEESLKKEEENRKALEERYSAEIEELKRKAAQKVEELQAIESEVRRTGEEKEQLKKQYEERIKEYLRKLSGLEDKNKKLSKDIEAYGKDSAEIERLKEEVNQKEKQLRSIEADAGRAGEEREQLKKQHEERIKEYLQKLSELEDTNKKLSEANSQFTLKEKTESEEIKTKIAEIETLKKRSETIVQENPMPILLMNTKLGIIVANSAFEKMSGISLQKLTKMNARNFKVLKQEGNGLKHTLERKIRADGEIEIEMPSGIHILEQYSIPIFNDKREIANILAVYNDVTEIRTKNAEIEGLREKERKEANLLTKSAELITEKMMGMTSGDLTVSAEIFEDDPLALLKTHFNRSVEEFRDLISVINEKANIIESTSEELSTNSGDISKANEKLALNSEESAEFLRDLMERFERISLGISDLSASIEEISSTSQEVTEQANQAAVEGKNAAEIGKEASENMENVGKISQQSVNEINLLNQEMYKINDIVKLIGGIAEQTNMLALNAAIEAARAGEHGRGFSVVAGEIRNLAVEAKDATRTIESLILEIQKNSNNTANSMRQADDEIHTGIESVNLAVNALYNIARDIEVASRGIAEISHATETQANEISSFMKNIDEANALTRGNLEKLEGMAAMAEEISATTEEVGSISHEMHNLSSDLQETMKKFRMD